MQISEEQLEKFRNIYKSKFGKEISKQKAYDSALSLLLFMKTTLKYHPKNKRKKKD